jgi:diacylglycerol kinase (ATP)
LATGLTLARYVLGVIKKDRVYWEAVPMSIYLDQRSCLKDDFMLVLITTVERLIFGLRPFWGTENAPLHVTLFHARPEHLINVLSLLACGKASRYRIPDNGYFSYNASEVRLRVTAGFTLDGELHPPASSNENIIITDGGQAAFLRL